MLKPFELLLKFLRGDIMLKNNIEIDIKTKCIEENRTQVQVAESIGTSPSYVNKIVRNKADRQ